MVIQKQYKKLILLQNQRKYEAVKETVLDFSKEAIEML